MLVYTLRHFQEPRNRRLQHQHQPTPPQQGLCFARRVVTILTPTNTTIGNAGCDTYSQKHQPSSPPPPHQSVGRRCFRGRQLKNVNIDHHHRHASGQALAKGRRKSRTATSFTTTTTTGVGACKTATSFTTTTTTTRCLQDLQ